MVSPWPLIARGKLVTYRLPAQGLLMKTPSSLFSRVCHQRSPNLDKGWFYGGNDVNSSLHLFKDYSILHSLRCDLDLPLENMAGITLHLSNLRNPGNGVGGTSARLNTRERERHSGSLWASSNRALLCPAPGLLEEAASVPFRRQLESSQGKLN